MNILILTPRYPFPENGGDVLRINGIARYLKKQGHTLCLVSFLEPNQEIDDEAKKLYDCIYTVKRKSWLSVLNSLIFWLTGKPIQCGYYYSKEFLRVLNKAIISEKPDLQICHLLRTVRYIEKLGLVKNTIVEMTDALSKTYAIAQNSKAFSMKKLIYRVEESRIKKYEQEVIRMFPKVVVVSQQDSEFLMKDIQKNVSSLSVHTNGVDTIDSISPTYNNNKICFIGNMRTLQNQDAVLHFVNDIFPIILKKEPNAKFYIVGAQPPQKIVDLASDNIIVTGFVESINDYISDACMAVAPVQIAAGIQNKVLVSMGCGIPVIMSSLISKAIPELKNKENCYIIDDDNDFANACVEFMQKPNLRMTVSEKGYEMVKKCYSWDSKLAGYELISNNKNSIQDN